MTASIDRTFDTTSEMNRSEIPRAEDTTVCEAVGVFHDVAALERAIDELLMEGFDRASLSLIASESNIEEKLRTATSAPYPKPTGSTTPRLRAWRMWTATRCPRPRPGSQEASRMSVRPWQREPLCSAAAPRASR